VDAETLEPYDTLTPVTVDWCRSVGSDANKVSDIIDNSDDKVGYVSTWSRVATVDEEAPIRRILTGAGDLKFGFGVVFATFCSGHFLNRLDRPIKNWNTFCQFWKNDL